MLIKNTIVSSADFVFIGKITFRFLAYVFLSNIKKKNIKSYTENILIKSIRLFSEDFTLLLKIIFRFLMICFNYIIHVTILVFRTNRLNGRQRYNVFLTVASGSVSANRSARIYLMNGK